MSTTAPPEIKEKILSFMESNGMRITSQRKSIIDAAFSTTDHYTAEELLDRARAMDSSVSRATIYRTLPVLVETGLLRELDLGKDQMYYDPNYATHPNHNHLIISSHSGKVTALSADSARPGICYKPLYFLSYL